MTTRKAVRLNLGCGSKLWDGFVNVDFPGNYSERKPDVECDITALPFDDNYADEIHAIHVIEHLDRRSIPDVLSEWKRVLRPGGKIAIECPCLDKIIRNASSISETDTDAWMRYVMLGLYGDHWRYDAANSNTMLHKWCYSIVDLKGLLQRTGFKGVEREEPLFHFPRRDMRFVAFKGT